jgi:hypothetical protein
LYKTYARDSGLKGVEVVAECTSLPAGEMTVRGMIMTMKENIVDPIAVEIPSQEKCQGVTHMVSLGNDLVKMNSEYLNLTLVRDEFDANTFDENLDNEQNVNENLDNTDFSWT